jgi:hypothetical protein
LDWDQIGKIRELSELFGTKGTRATAKAAAERLASFIRLRNRIAHTAAGEVPVSADELRGYIRFFRLFAPGLATVVAAKIQV